MIRILLVFGTRPEAIKIAPLIFELKKSKNVETVICNTGQHEELVDQVIRIFNIIVDYDLNLMKKDQKLVSLTTGLLENLDMVVKEVKPDWILAQGDTTTAMCASMIAFYNKILFGHIEAGLRTYDKYQPYPEEINRKIISSIADLHFAPTQRAMDALLRENINPQIIKLTGNTIIDALNHIRCYSAILNINEFPELDFRKKIILVTAHRRENFGKPFINICEALKAVAEEFHDVEIVFPVHLNPNIRKVTSEILYGISNVKLLEPVDYKQIIFLLSKAYLVVTDSGGIQEEAPSFKIPILILRNATERPEGVEAGCAKLIGTEATKIKSEISKLLKSRQEYKKMTKADNPYGDGSAANKITKEILLYER